MLRRGLGRVISGAKSGKVGMGLLAAGVIAAGVNSADPLKPVTQGIQEEVLGDPNAIRSFVGASTETFWRDQFLEDWETAGINRTRGSSGSNRAPVVDGSVVFGMYNTRMK